MAEKATKDGPLARWRRLLRRKRLQRGGAPEKRAAHHIPTTDPADLTMRLGGVERDTRFTKD